MQKLGIYPGTFDPIHMGHLAFALETINACMLDEVVFLPEPIPRSKMNVTPVNKRYEQIETMIEPYPRLNVKILTSSQFTVQNTLIELQQRFPHAQLTLLVGSDVALTLPEWGGIDRLLTTCNIAIGMRTHQTQNDLDRLANRLKADYPVSRLKIIKTDYPALASSLFRKK